MNRPNPAIVAQAAVRRFPRAALLLLCAAYVLSGFIGRDAWKSADITALGYMAELVAGTSQWLAPTLMGATTDNPALLPYWLGAWAMQVAPSWIAPDFAVRIPFGLLLTLALLATWYGTYYLARSPRAQPVAFAFGGEARPTDYARAIADGGVLAFIACLGLAQLSHETTLTLAQLSFTALLFYAISALPYHRISPAIAALIGLAGLALSGAPAMAMLFGFGSAWVHALDHNNENTPDRAIANRSTRAWEIIAILVGSAAVAVLSWKLGLWRWKLALPKSLGTSAHEYLQLLVWFTWPAWPLALLTIWQWRRQLFSRRISRHLALPVWFVTVTVIATFFTTGSSDRILLLGLPALAALAAFALPTLKRQVAALIDWFTLLFFSVCGLTIWVVWIAMQTGFPSQPAANVARLAPGFESSFSALAMLTAIAATLAWAWLVRWRVGRHRAAIWKSLVLPAGGAALCWLLLMTLWMPLLNYAQSHAALVRRALEVIGPTDCIEAQRLDQSQVAAFQFYGKLQLRPSTGTPSCQWLLAEPTANGFPPKEVDLSQWAVKSLITHSAGGEETVLVLKRLANP